MLRQMANEEEESENDVEVVGTGMGSNVVSSNVDTAVEIDVDDEMEEPVDEDEIMTDENSDNNNIDIDGASEMGREDLDIMETRENPVENEEIDLETGCKISPGVFVEVIKGNFVGYFASVLEKVENDYKIQYFKQRKSKQHGNYWVFSNNDHDIRSADELKRVEPEIDWRGRFFFI